MADSSEVYDLLHPSPPPLKSLACTAVAFDLCRREIKRHLKSDGCFRTPEKETFLQCLMPHIPSKLFSLIKQTAEGLSMEINRWFDHHAALLPPKFGIFNNFMDFYFDLDGKIDYAKTGERLLLCDQVSDEAKFKVACWYCLENDILQLWPKVSLCFSEDEFSLACDTQMYYWVKRLNNRLGELTLDEETPSVEEVILNALFNKFLSWKWPSVEYFLNRVGLNVCVRFLVKTIIEKPDGGYNYDRKTICYRYILPKLKKETLHHLVATRGAELIVSTPSSCITFVWEYIKNEMTADRFCRLVEFILKNQTWVCQDWCKIWSSAPSRLERSAMPGVLQELSLFISDDWDGKSMPCYHWLCSQCATSISHRIIVSVLIMMLPDAPVECRRTFWIKNWHIMINDIKFDEFHALVNLCFNGDQSQITQFKKDAISLNYKPIIEWSSVLLRENHFDELENFLKFWHVDDESAIQDIRMKVLSENHYSLSMTKKARLLNEFIDKAYSEVELAIKFKTSLFMSPKTRVFYKMRENLMFGFFRVIMEYIDFCAPSPAVATQIKKEKVVPAVVEWLQTTTGICSSKMYCDGLETFMDWLLNDSVTICRFKEMLDVNKFVLKVEQGEKNNCKTKSEPKLCDKDHLHTLLFRCFRESQCRNDSPSVPSPLLKKILKLYFATQESFDEFVNKYADNELFVRLLMSSPDT